ncbi:hypothetical protein STEG23_012139 [Scotinomys teguina]
MDSSLLSCPQSQISHTYTFRASSAVVAQSSSLYFCFHGAHWPSVVKNNSMLELFEQLHDTGSLKIVCHLMEDDFEYITRQEEKFGSSGLMKGSIGAKTSGDNFYLKPEST